MDQKRKSYLYIITQTINALNKERILKAIEEKGQVKYKGSPITNTPDFATETLKAEEPIQRLYRPEENTNTRPGYYTLTNTKLSQMEKLKYFRTKPKGENHILIMPPITKT